MDLSHIDVERIIVVLITIERLIDRLYPVLKAGIKAILSILKPDGTDGSIP